jgi:hypothetical protein
MKYRRQGYPVLGVFWLIAYFALSDVSLAGLPDNNPVPGGVAVVTLPGLSDEKPDVRFGDKQVYVTLKNLHWVAVVGLPLDILPGKYILMIDTDFGDFSKKRFRIEPLPPSKTLRTVMLPENLNSLEFSPDNSATYVDIVKNETELDSPLEPDFIFDQIVSAGSYLPYGFLFKQQNPVDVIKHPSITYITREDEIVSAPAAAVVEQIYLSETSGLTVVLNHGDGLKSIISYLHDTILKPGESINSGDIVGAAKTVEGLSSGRVDWHLMLNGFYIDPLQFSPST